MGKSSHGEIILAWSMVIGGSTSCKQSMSRMSTSGTRASPSPMLPLSFHSSGVDEVVKRPNGGHLHLDGTMWGVHHIPPWPSSSPLEVCTHRGLAL